MGNGLYCVHCGKELKGGQKKFCSKNCSNLEQYYARREYRAEKQKSHYCPWCGSEVTDFKRIYCSDKCARLSNAARRNERELREKEEALKWEKEIYERVEKIEQRKNVSMTFDEVVKGMKETGLSYGEYVAKYDRKEV